jgi:hypothetical protein
MLKGCFWGAIALDSLYVPIILQGLGSGMVDIPLLVAAQAGCVRRGDVSTATGLSLTLKALAEMLALALCQAMERYYEPMMKIDILRPIDYGIEGRDSVKSVWGNLIIISILVLALNFATVVTFLHSVRLCPTVELEDTDAWKDDLTKRQQHVTGTVFGAPDASTSDKEDEPSEIQSEAGSSRQREPGISPV